MPNKYTRDEVYPFLVQSLHSAKPADDFFRSRLNDESLLATLLEVARDDVSDDARMEAAYWASQFPAELLEPFENKLRQLSLESWESINVHAKTALDKVAKLEAYAIAS
jgi:hypothetical protein